MACVAAHFTEYRATAIGIVSAGSGCGNVFSASPANLYLNRLRGCRLPHHASLPFQ